MNKKIPKHLKALYIKDKEGREPKAGTVAGICPKCGAQLLWKVSKKAGVKYRGCQNYNGGCRYNDKNWYIAYRNYDRVVNLWEFKKQKGLSGFNRIITPENLRKFERRFQIAIDRKNNFTIVGEVYFWKVYRQDTDTQYYIITKLLNRLEDTFGFNSFTSALKKLSEDPSWNNFVSFRISCGQHHSFVIPITFLSFYNPIKYPVVDRYIACWWQEKKEKYGYKNFPVFERNEKGNILCSINSWNAYLGWKRFCTNYAKKLTGQWRVRDVEMAVGVAQLNKIDLEIL